jgi:hypothetical protein
MNKLRDLVLAAHGIDRRKTVRMIEADTLITALLWATKGWPDALKQVRVTADNYGQRVDYQPFAKPNWRSVYRPETVNPRAAFQGHAVETPC